MLEKPQLPKNDHADGGPLPSSGIYDLLSTLVRGALLSGEEWQQLEEEAMKARALLDEIMDLARRRRLGEEGTTRGHENISSSAADSGNTWLTMWQSSLDQPAKRRETAMDETKHSIPPVELEFLTAKEVGKTRKVQIELGAGLDVDRWE